MSVYEGIMQGLTEALEYAQGKRELRTEWGITPLHYKGYSARLEYSAEDRIFYGKILGISDLVDFQSESAQALEDEFHKAVDDYLEFCAETGKPPQREHIGTKMITVPELGANADKYVEMAQTQDIFIIQNGKMTAKLTSAEHRKG